MIKELKPNYDDDYSWHEVNCFFRAWSIALKSYHSSYFNNFLQAMFLNWTFFPESISATENDDFVLESNGNVLSPLFNVVAEKVYYSSEDQFYSEINTRISEKARLIIPGDIFNIYYNASYQTKHNDHYFIMKGYDEATRRYYILDNLHLKSGSSTLYEDFVIPWNTLYESNQLFFSHFQTSSASYFWSIQQLSPVHTNNTKLIFQANLHILTKYIDSYKDHEFEQMISQHESKAEQIHQFFMKFNHKNTYFKILHNVFKSLDIDTTYFEELISAFRELKMKIPISLAGSEGSVSIFEQYTELEKSLLLHMRELILQYLQKDAETQSEFGLKSSEQLLLDDSQMLNETNVSWQLDEEVMSITHSSLRKTDTWISENEAFQLLWKNDDGSDDLDVLEIAIENDNEPGLPFQSGIIIVYPHETVLFGPLQNIKMSLFVPQRLSDYSLKEIQYLQRSVRLKVHRDSDNGLLLYYKGPEDEEYVLFTDKSLSPNFTEIGVFSRTWEHIDHTTMFTDFIVYNHKIHLKGSIEDERITS
ncbi:hypothetical protein D3C74_116280 [compost metagenome]